MLIAANTPQGTRTKVLDFMGKEIQWIKNFNTETKEAEIFIPCKELRGSTGRIAVVQTDPNSTTGEALTVKTVLLGCKAVDRETGLEIA